MTLNCQKLIETNNSRKKEDDEKEHGGMRE